jgi:glycopeptide antibiotics resistance protein
MTAETEEPRSSSRPVTSAPVAVPRNSWGRTALRLLILVIAFAALVAFSVVLAELTLTPSPASAHIAGSNLRPGHSLRQYADDYTFLAACKQIGGNLVMGAPFGLILPVLLPRRLRLIRVVVLTALVMVLVELAQGSLVEGRAFDVDDVILNTSGALIGYLLLGRRIGRKYHSLAEPLPAAERRAPGESRWRRAPASGREPMEEAPTEPLRARLLRGRGSGRTEAARETRTVRAAEETKAARGTRTARWTKAARAPKEAEPRAGKGGKTRRPATEPPQEQGSESRWALGGRLRRR